MSFNNIHELILKLIYSKNFYARLFSGLNKIATNEISTAAVCVDPRTHLGVALLYNPQWIEEVAAKDLNSLAFILEHEGYHLLAQHIQRFISDPIISKMGDKLSNIAMDFSANSLIIDHYHGDIKKHLLEIGGKFPEEYGYKPRQAFEAYLHLLDKDPKFRDIKMEDMLQNLLTQPHLWSLAPGTGDSDEGSGKPSSSNIPADMQKIRNKLEFNLPKYIKDTLDAHVKNAGNIPGHVQELVSKYQKPEVQPPWCRVLTARVKSGISSIRVRSLTRPNRRFLCIPGISKFPGRNIDRGYKIAFILDTSGSMSRDDIEEGLGTMLSLLDYNSSLELWMIEADMIIHHTYKLKQKSDLKLDIHGRGGTDFIMPINWAIEEVSPDIIVYFTDGYGAAPPSPPSVPVVWCITRGGQVPAPYGMVVQM